MNEREKAIERVRKLLALANDRAATPAEASLAKERAYELILKYEITKQDLNPDQPVFVGVFVQSARTGTGNSNPITFFNVRIFNQ